MGWNGLTSATVLNTVPLDQIAEAANISVVKVWQRSLTRPNKRVNYITKLNCITLLMKDLSWWFS